MFMFPTVYCSVCITVMQYENKHICARVNFLFPTADNKTDPNTSQNLMHTLARAVKRCASAAVRDFGCNSNVHCHLFFNYMKLQFLTFRGIPCPKFRYYTQ